MIDSVDPVYLKRTAKAMRNTMKRTEAMYIMMRNWPLRNAVEIIQTGSVGIDYVKDIEVVTKRWKKLRCMQKTKLFIENNCNGIWSQINSKAGCMYADVDKH